MRFQPPSREFRRVFASGMSATTGFLILCACPDMMVPAMAGAPLEHPSLPNYYPIIGGLPRNGGLAGLLTTAPRVVIDESSNGRVVLAHPGDLIEVRLKASGGIPYAWVLGAMDGTSVVPNGVPRNETDPGLEVGRPVTRVVPFQAVGVGGTTLQFELKSMVPLAPPAQTFSVTVRVISNRRLPRK